jgi:hypothetical protein
VRFYLGTHMPSWLADAGVPLFVSHTRLAGRHTFPRAAAPWALDSGAFSEVGGRGGFSTTPAQYVAAVRRYRDEVGRLEWAAPQDHMCEPPVLARSRLANTVAEAQRWTVHNLVELRELDPPVPVVPVLQGQTVGDYLEHVDQYDRAGIDLTREQLVGVGSVCRKEATDEIAAIMARLAGLGLNLHGFGVKSSGLRRYGWALGSCDSLAWSRRGRNVRPCPHSGAASCGNCRPHALAWRRRVLTAAEPGPVQLALPIDMH